MKVVVVGSGIAGVAAGIASGSSGATVTLLEGSDRLAPNRALFPYVLSGEHPKPQSRDLSLLSAAGVEVRFNERVLSVDPQSRTLVTGDERLGFDSLVIATGSHYLGGDVKGISKQGVFLMRSLDDYLALSRSVATLSHVAVAGPPPLCLVVSQILSRYSKVRVFMGPLGLRRFSPAIGNAIAQAAALYGVELQSSGVDAVIGAGRVEAVLSSGRVYPCDGVVILPRSVPALPETGCSTGSHGGLLVDHWMRTSSRNIFAAGDCAELRLGSVSLPNRLHSSSRVMGKVAGLNATGASVQANLSGSVSMEAFGVEVCTAGIDAEEGLRAGLDTIRTDSGDGTGEEFPRASIVYDRSTRRVHGLQVAGKGALSLSEYASFVVASGATLEELAYHESPYLPGFNGDESPISLTAGKALVHLEARSLEAPGTHLRYGRR